jgi:hypothetical protein
MAGMTPDRGSPGGDRYPLSGASPPLRAVILISLRSDDIVCASTANLILGAEVFSGPASRNEIMAEAMSQDSALGSVVRCFVVSTAGAAGII